MAVIHLSKRTIDKLVCREGKNVDLYFDDELHGFGIAVYPAGGKAFFVMYGQAHKRRRMSIGKYGALTCEQARTKAKEIMAKLNKGSDPIETKTAARTLPTFSKWAAEYLKTADKRKKNPKPDHRYLGMAVKAFGKKLITAVTVEDVQTIRDRLDDEGKRAEANRFLASVRACMQEAYRKGHIESNPVFRIRGLPERPPRERVLSDDEFKRILEAIDKIADPFIKAAFTLLVQTGARLSEVLHAEWRNIDLEQRLWALPSTKAGKRQVLPLTPNIAKLLAELPRLGPYVIPGHDPNKPRFDLKNPWEKLKTEAKLTDVCIHDLRRSFGLQVAKKSGLHVASKLLRHSDIRVTERVYAPLGIDDLRDALVEREKGMPSNKKNNNKWEI